jgi:cytochrome c-type biogenesis protein CcmH/NrfF
MPGKNDLAYLAGIIDGEGSIECRLGRSATIQLVVGNTDRRLIDWLVSEFGGRVYAQKRKGVKTLYSWRIPIRRERVLMEAVAPYLKLKREQLEVAFALASLSIVRGRGRRVPEENTRQREALVVELRRLKNARS